MQKQTTYRIIALVVGLMALGFGITFSVNAYNGYSNTAANLTELQSKVHLEVIHTTAADGSAQKALYYTSLINLNKTDHSVPLVIFCHGMGGNYLNFMDVCTTFLYYGYALIIPEFRGHGSNVVPTSLGYSEPGDIIKWLDYAETNYPAINVSNSAVAGHSMGGLYAFSSYYLESQGRGRFKCCVDVSGPVNLTRELTFLTNNPNAIGTLPFINNMDEKNPVNHVNETNPKNILIMHGTADTIVDFRCATDLNATINPHNNRTDMQFYPILNEGHNIMEYPFVIGKTVAWVDYYVKNNNTDYTTIQLQSSPFHANGASNGQKNAMNAAFALMMAIPLLLYVVVPNAVVVPRSAIYDDQHAIHINKKKKWQFVGVYWGMIFLFGCIGLLIPSFILSELILVGVATVCTILILYYKGISKEEQPIAKERIKEWLNIRTALPWVICIALFFELYLAITSSQWLEDQVIEPGARNTWYFAYLTILFTLQLCANIIFIRLLQDKPIHGVKSRIQEMFLNGFIYGVGVIIFFFWAIGSTIAIPAWFDFEPELTTALCLICGVLFVVFDLFTQITESLTKTIIPGALIMGMVLPIFQAVGDLIFFY